MQTNNLARPFAMLLALVASGGACRGAGNGNTAVGEQR
jgi:hypothetical protein